jgi:hypothetical protein
MVNSAASFCSGTSEVRSRVTVRRQGAHDNADRAKGGKKKRTKHQSHRFVEGWIEFEDKKVARSVADMLNARPIGAAGSFAAMKAWSRPSPRRAQVVAFSRRYLDDEVSP